MSRLIRKVVLFLVFFLPVAAISQQVEIHAESRPLNELLIDLSNRYGIQLSFDDRELSHFKITLSGIFKSPESAIAKVIENLPLEMISTGDVIIIVPNKSSSKPKLTQ